MTTEARFNLQRGKEESYYNQYTIESLLDNYLIQKQRLKARVQAQQNALENYVMEIIDTELQDCLEKALDNVLENLSPL